MNTTHWFQRRSAICAIVALGLATATSHAAVTADPSETTFTLPDQSATIKLMDNGAPIPASDILGWKFLASGHDYKHMIDVEKMDGALRISPSTTVELGSYDLEVETSRGPVVVRVFAPMSDVPNIVEKLAALTGQSEQKAAEKLGLTSTTGRENTQIKLPPVYYEGQTLELTIPAKPGSGHTCLWFVNGDAVAEGTEHYTVSYTFQEPGDFVLTYVETTKESGSLVIVTSARAITRVVPLPAVATDATVNTTITFSPPAGYQKHVWRIDGQEVPGDSVLKHTFREPGTYAVECLASSPDRGPETVFLRIRFHTTITSV